MVIGEERVNVLERRMGIVLGDGIVSGMKFN